MPRKFILSVAVLLIITNIATLLFWKADKKVLIEGNREINSNQNVAIVGDEEISYNDWINSLQAAYGKAHLETMIDRSIVRQLAGQENIIVHDKIIDRELSMLITMQGIMTDEELDQKIKRWREEIIYRYQLEALLIDEPIAEEEIHTYYETYGDQFNFTETIQLSHIVIESFNEAERVIQDLDDGASFNLLAQETSIDEATRDRGGYLGFITGTNSLMDEQYFFIANNTEQGSYSDPFQTNDGVVIIYVHLKLPEITFTYEEVKPYITSELLLNDLEQPISTNALKDQLPIEWIYEIDDSE